MVRWIYACWTSLWLGFFPNSICRDNFCIFPVPVNCRPSPDSRYQLTGLIFCIYWGRLNKDVSRLLKRFSLNSPRNFLCLIPLVMFDHCDMFVTCLAAQQLPRKLLAPCWHRLTLSRINTSEFRNSTLKCPK